MQRSFINFLSIGSLWDAGSLFKIHPMPTARNINPAQRPTSTHSSMSDSCLSSAKLANVFGRYSTLCLHRKPKLTSDWLGEGTGCLPPATRGFRMKYDSIVFLLNGNSFQLNACFFLAWGSSFQWKQWWVLFCVPWTKAWRALRYFTTRPITGQLTIPPVHNMDFTTVSTGVAFQWNWDNIIRAHKRKIVPHTIGYREAKLTCWKISPRSSGAWKPPGLTSSADECSVVPGLERCGRFPSRPICTTNIQCSHTTGECCQCHHVNNRLRKKGFQKSHIP